jgi:pullulanase
MKFCRPSGIRVLFAISLVLLLSACGGGGATTPSAAVTPVTPSTPPVAAENIRIHFHSAQNDAGSWGVYAWVGPKVPSLTWISDRFLFAKSDSFGGYVDIPLDTKLTAMKFLITDGAGNKNCNNDQDLTFSASLASAGQEIWIAPGDCTLYDKTPVISPAKLANATAYWMTSTTLAWPGAPATGNSYKLYFAANAGLSGSATDIVGADGSYTLTVDNAGLSPALQAQYPHLKSALALNLSAADAANAKVRLKGQLVLAQFDGAGKLVQATSLQTANVLDNLYAGAAANTILGPSFDANGVPTIRVWAPSAKSVSLNFYADANTASKTTVSMQEDTASGVWSYTDSNAARTNTAYYTLSVNVLSRWADNKFVSNEVTDPYSVSLNANSKRSFLADLSSSASKPAGWDSHAIPALAHPTDIALYELHMRDFSVSDATVPAAHKGKFLAFTDTASNGMLHLKMLEQAGMTHIHLLPTFDIASINETGCVNPTVQPAAADSETQQATVAASKDSDCFNWGYDPQHYTAPEGSYSTDANNGMTRILEYRAMMKALHENGLRVAMDVVYNHTAAAKQNDKSVLDKIVPGYYFRTTATGEITADSCCSDTASENAMMGKLIIDSVKTWATQYKVDSFRFDIMGMHPLALMMKLNADVNAAAGRDIYLYGEAWNIGGATFNDARFVQARQNNMAGSGIGSFNDRVRDAVRGGGCCDDDANTVSQQGFINGVFYDRNATSTQTVNDLLRLGDLVRVGLSASLKDYVLTDYLGNTKPNSQIDYAGQKAGFTGQPQETINYVEAHDNQALFDINAFKLPLTTSISDRVRVQNLGNAIAMFSQGVPFFQAGQDLLRSKSLDRDSYNAGDWFNALDFSYQRNNFGVGLPSAEKNQGTWPLMRPILTNPLIKPGMSEILNSRNNFLDLLAIRKSSTLFRLRTAQDVMERLQFYNVGPGQVPGMIVMRIDGQSPSAYAGANYKSVVVVFNVDKLAKNVTVASLSGKTFVLHPTQLASSADAVVKSASFNKASGTFSIPARTVAVFVE